MPLLNPGEQFPELTITTTTTIGDETHILPDAFAGDFGFVLFTSGVRLLRVAAQARAEHGQPAVGAVPSAGIADDRSATDEARDGHIVMTWT